MGATPAVLRPGRLEDADILAEPVNCAGDGLPLYLWSKLASPDNTGWDLGRARAAREDGSFSYKNATMIEDHGRAVGA